MKPLTINTNSWHYYLATIYGPMSRYSLDRDLCSYTKSVFGGMLIVLLIIFMGGLVAVAAYASILGWGVASIVMHSLLPMGELAIISIVFQSCLILSVLIYKFFSIIFNIVSRASRVPVVSTFVSRTYQSWREKSCVPVVFNKE
jgi:hypothetical protein